MRVNFKVNPGIPLEDIHDSMQLDSGTVIATLEAGDYRLKLEVEGEVKVYWNPNGGRWDGHDSEMYKCASQMPDELLALFANGYDTGRKDIEVCNNNWYEAIVSYKGMTVFSDLADMDGLNPSGIFTSLWDMYLEFKENEAQLEREFQERMKDIPAPDGETEDLPANKLINDLRSGMSGENVHDILAGTLYDGWNYPVGRLNDMHYKYDARNGRNGGLEGA
jgi:hypothetical protein